MPKSATQPAPAIRHADTSLSIRAHDVSKLYRIYDKPFDRLLDLFAPNPKRSREFWALRRVYLDVPKGSTVGIIGQNGAGKSTLLKLLSGVTEPTTGSVHVNGRVTSLIELGAGFHPEFSGRENIALACAILGMSREEVRELAPRVIEFSELGDFIDRPVKTYSSGMYVRLGFAVATCVDPDVLLIDEALSVGDEHFRGKCLTRLNEFRDGGGTTVFVSHDLGAVKSMCQNVVLIDQGEIVEQGAPERVATEYLKRVKARGNERLSMLARGTHEFPRWGSGEIEVHDVQLLGGDGQPTRVLRTGEHAIFRLSYRAHSAVRCPVFGLGIYRSDGTYVCGTNHFWREQPIVLESVEPGEVGEVDMALGAFPLLEGQYYLTTFLYDHSKPAPTAIDHREHALTFQVLDALHHQHGLVYLPAAWAVRRHRAGADAPENLESGR
ncbi:MAG: ABC transporter ATP-binding protein [Planctomycetota bacterium]|nr:MAG: ABC transporter ATP-binding protein [Planctomycetota bacterium]